jgi:DNA-directed RNA polymerase specialized sigma24 family protein
MRTETIQLLSIDFIQNKNNITFSKLIKRLKPGLKNYLYKFSKDFDVIEDIIQNTFIRI